MLSSALGETFLDAKTGRPKHVFPTGVVSERDISILKCRLNGATMVAIAKDFGITNGRVAQIIDNVARKLRRFDHGQKHIRGWSNNCPLCAKEHHTKWLESDEGKEFRRQEQIADEARHAARLAELQSKRQEEERLRLLHRAEIERQQEQRATQLNRQLTEDLQRPRDLLITVTRHPNLWTVNYGIH